MEWQQELQRISNLIEYLAQNIPQAVNIPEEQILRLDAHFDELSGSILKIAEERYPIPVIVGYNDPRNAVVNALRIMQICSAYDSAIMRLEEAQHPPRWLASLRIANRKLRKAAHSLSIRNLSLNGTLRFFGIDITDTCMPTTPENYIQLIATDQNIEIARYAYEFCRDELENAVNIHRYPHHLTETRDRSTASLRLLIYTHGRHHQADGNLLDRARMLGYIYLLVEPATYERAVLAFDISSQFSEYQCVRDVLDAFLL